MFFRQRAAELANGGRTHLRASLLAKSLALAIVTIHYAHADSNLLPNGDFSDAKQITGWTGEPAGAIEFSPTDLDGSPSSGSLVVRGDLHQLGTATSSCFEIEPRTSYSFGGEFIGSISGGFSLGDEGEATFSCMSFSTTNCSGPASTLGSTPIGIVDVANAPFSLTFINPTDLTARSAHCSASIETTSSSLSGSAPAVLQLDNLHFAVTNPNPISLGGYLSGSWYDPKQSGQGFDLEFTAQANTLVAEWFTFAPDGSGKPIWIYAQGKYDPLQSVVTIPAAISSGTSFPPAFHESDITKTLWGTLTFSFTDCNHASVAWNSSIPSYGSGTQQLQRLTSIDGLSCPSTGVFF